MQSATKLSGKPRKENTTFLVKEITLYNELVNRDSEFCVNKRKYLVLCFSVC